MADRSSTQGRNSVRVDGVSRNEHENPVHTVLELLVPTITPIDRVHHPVVEVIPEPSLSGSPLELTATVNAG